MNSTSSTKPAFPIARTKFFTTVLGAKPIGPFNLTGPAVSAWFQRLLLSLLAMTLPMMAQAQFQYSVTNGQATITNYTGPGGNVIIPDTLGGSPVISIGDWAFNGKSSLTNVSFPNTLTHIANHAFYGCSSLTSATFPTNLTDIGFAAFAACGLKSVSIPNSVTNIGTSAFSGCYNLTNISVSAGNPVFSSGSGVLFNKLKTTLVEYPPGLVGGYVIPNSVTTVGLYAFFDRTNLTSATLPIGVTTIEEGAFLHCRNLTSVTLPNSITTIGNSAFFDCSSLTSVTFPSSVASIEVGSFNECSNLTAAYFQGNAPSNSGLAFSGANLATVYYLVGTSGWGATFSGRPTVQWNPHILTENGFFGVQANHFGFTFMGAANVRVAIEACTDLAQPDWVTVSHLTCGVDGQVQFTDPAAANLPSRYYRFRPE